MLTGAGHLSLGKWKDSSLGVSWFEGETGGVYFGLFKLLELVDAAGCSSEISGSLIAQVD